MHKKYPSVACLIIGIRLIFQRYSTLRATHLMNEKHFLMYCTMSLFFKLRYAHLYSVRSTGQANNGKTTGVTRFHGGGAKPPGAALDVRLRK